MITKLLEIKEFILSEIRIVVNGSMTISETDLFINKLDAYLLKLTLDFSDKAEQKACRQLLCSIGIDLKHGTVTPQHYYKIFSKMDFDNPKCNPRKLFNDVVFNERLEYHADLRTTTEYCIMVFPVKDYQYYIDPKVLGISGSLQLDFRIKKLKEKIKKNVPILKISELRKKTPLSYFWLSTKEPIEGILKKATMNPVLEVVDRLGLSHFNFSSPDNKFFFCLDFGNMEVDTFKPNATMVNWTTTSTGFISHMDKYFGKTFCISGYKDFKEGLNERSFNAHKVDAGQLECMKLTYIETTIDNPILISDDVVIEGIKRFNS